MSIDLNESISSLIDGELEATARKKVFDKLKQDSESQQRWARYSLIGQAIKKDLPANPSNALFARIQVAVEAEPALLSPSPSSIADETNATNVVELPSKTAVAVVPADIQKRKPLISFAAAASFVLMAVVGYQFLSLTSNTNITTVAPLASIQQPVAVTPQFQVASTPNTGVSAVSTASEERFYAEQSMVNDGQWTRITHIGNMSLNGRLIGQPLESRASVTDHNSATPLARAVNVDDAVKQ